MTIRLEMLRKAEQARALLDDSTALVVEFIGSQRSDDGGFVDRASRSDLYYTVFGLESLAAVGADLPAGPLERYLRTFGDGESLDLVHLACLARCWAGLSGEVPADLNDRISWRIARFRSRGGGFANEPGSDRGTVYASFLALGAYEDLGANLPEAERVAETIMRCTAAGGGFANEPGMDHGTTTVTAAAMISLARLGTPVPGSAAEWLLSMRHESGGFPATAGAPLPDLLSTATALHALRGAGVSLDGLREEGIDFVESLWSGTGGFRGHWADDHLDCEYAFYGLLALGNLAE